MSAPASPAHFRRRVLHRLLYRLGQGVLVYWTLLAMLAPASSLPSRWEILVSGLGVLAMLILPRPGAPPEQRGVKARRGQQRLAYPLVFLV